MPGLRHEMPGGLPRKPEPEVRGHGAEARQSYTELPALQGSLRSAASRVWSPLELYRTLKGREITEDGFAADKGLRNWTVKPEEGYHASSFGSMRATACSGSS